MALKLISFNVHGLNSPFKWKVLNNYVRSLHGDNLFVQETHFAKNKVSQLYLKNFMHIFTVNAEKKKAGVLIAIAASLNFQLISSQKDDNGCFLILVCKFNDVLYTLVNIYAPNVRQIAFLNKMLKKISSCWQGFLILGGDLIQWATLQLIHPLKPSINHALSIHLSTKAICMTSGGVTMILKEIIPFSLWSTTHIHV